MVYIPGYDWYLILGLFNTKVKRSLWSRILHLMWEARKGCPERTSGTGLWIQTWSNLENVTITSTYFTALQHTQLFSI